MTPPLASAEEQRRKVAGDSNGVDGTRDEMNAVKIAAIVLIVAGILGLAYGSFSYTKETHDAKVGPIELSVKDTETVNVPAWAGLGAIVIGGVILLLPGKTR